MKKTNIAIIGAGLIGRKRAMSLPKGVVLKVVCDVSKDRAESFSKDFNCEYSLDFKNVLSGDDIDAVIISTSHDQLVTIALQAIKNGKHVFMEKPGARNVSEFNKIIDAYHKNKVVIMVGYNHRYHPAILKAKQIVDSNKYGPVLFIRAKYGHGGRLNYDKEWRFNKKISGGGQLLDQGSHLIDLVNNFVSDMKLEHVHTDTLFWDTDLEDSAFMILSKRGVVANLSTTCLEWKNVFSFEIMLKTAKIQIDGLGKSYGTEKLTLYKMKPKMGPPNVSEYIFDGEDKSWARETKIFFDRIQGKKFGTEELDKAKHVLDIINKSYRKK